MPAPLGNQYAAGSTTSGRPTDYNEEVLIKTREYLDSTGDFSIVKQRPQIKDGKHIGEEDYRVEKIKLPSIEGLSYILDVTKSTISEWRKRHEVFSVLIDKLLAKQAEMLIVGGLSGSYNSVISKVLLTKHGYSDKQETDITSKGEKIVIMPGELIDKNAINESPIDNS